MPPASTPPEFDRFAVVTIQGGGLYGLNLLGQLSYLIEQVGIVPVAVAGNSAGSIVAALYWAGYAPWEIRDIFAAMAKEKKLSALVHASEPDGPPFTLADFRSLKDDCERFADGLLTSDPPAGIVKRCLGRVREPLRTASKLWSLRRLRNRIAPHYEPRGCFGGDNFIHVMDRLIRNGPLLRDRELPTGGLLRFGAVRDLVAEDPEFYAPALFLAATNVTKRELVVFDSIDTRFNDVEIARAVRASAGFPAFFRPVDFKDKRFAGWYADGGIVSNYPAWIFSKAFRVKLLDSREYRQLATRPWVHFGLRLERSPITTELGTEDPKVYVSSLTRLLLGGEARTDLEERLEGLVTRSYTIQSPAKCQIPSKPGTEAPKDLLDIDSISAELVNEMYRLGREESVYRLGPDETCPVGPLSYILPEKSHVEPLLEQLIERAYLVFGRQENTDLLLRSNVFIPYQKVLHIQYAANMARPEPGAEAEPTANNDHDIQLPLDAGLTGACMTTRRPLICNLGALSRLPRKDQDGLFGMPEGLYEKVRRDRTWLASVPIFDPFATFPRELSPPGRGDLPHPTIFSHGLAGRTDGAVLGVLNLDAHIEYDCFQPPIDSDPRLHCTDRRIEAILHLMAATAAEIGECLSRHFASRIPIPTGETSCLPTTKTAAFPSP